MCNSAYLYNNLLNLIVTKIMYNSMLIPKHNMFSHLEKCNILGDMYTKYNYFLTFNRTDDKRFHEMFINVQFI